MPEGSPERSRVLLIGWDGASWTQINPLLDSGAMPHLASMVERGVMGDLASLHPPSPHLLWTSLSTGYFADRHGVLGEWEPDPVTAGARTVTRASLTASHVWDLLAREGLRCQSIGWPVTHPASLSLSTCISDAFADGDADSVHPPGLESILAPLRFHPQEWTGDELALFVPELNRIDQDKDRRLAKLALILAADVSAHATATTLLERGAWDFSAIRFGAAGRCSAEFPEGGDDLYRDTVSGAYRFLDLLLGRLLQLAGPDCVSILVSNRGSGRHPRAMLCACGPGIEPDQLAFGSSLLDMAPTILGLFGFAPASGMPGRRISEICPTQGARELLPSEHQDSSSINNIDDLATELEALGYSDSVAQRNRPQAETARQRRDSNLAQVLMSQRRFAEAVPIFQRLAAANPENAEFRLYLAHAYFLTSRHAECRDLCDGLLAQFANHPLAPLARTHLAIAKGDYREAREHLASSKHVGGINAALEVSVGDACLLLGEWSAAEENFRSAIQTDPLLAEAHAGLARALLNSARYGEAAEAALDAIRLRYDFAPAHKTLSDALRAMGREVESAQAFAQYESLHRSVPA